MNFHERIIMRYYVLIFSVLASTFLTSPGFSEEKKPINLLKNPGAETVVETNKYPIRKFLHGIEIGKTVPLGWGYFGLFGKAAWEASDKSPHSGKYCVQLTIIDGKQSNNRKLYTMAIVIGGETNGYMPENSLKVTPGEKYGFSFWFKGDFAAKVYVRQWCSEKDIPPNNFAWSKKRNNQDVRLSCDGRKLTAGKNRIPPSNQWRKYSGEFTALPNAKYAVVIVQNNHALTPQKGQKIMLDDAAIYKIEKTSKKDKE